ncbi:MAG: DUF6702 family protein [Bacteroidota bacterium]|nr:DUF6702 family protein [Bacteroidota bacterium]
MCKLIFKLGLIFFWLVFVSFHSIHPLKATSTRLLYSDAEKQYVLEFEVFRDDFQNCLNQEFNSRYNLYTFYNGEEQLSFVSKFFNTYIHFKINNKLIEIKFKKGVNEDDKNSFIFTAPITELSAKGNKKLEVENTMLIKYFPNQSNMVIVNFFSTQKMWLFNKDYISDKIVF